MFVSCVADESRGVMNASAESDPASAIQRWLSCHDEKAAAWLFRENRPQVLRMARAAGAPGWMEEDVVQEVFLRVFRSLPRFEPRMPFAHWVAGITRNTCAKLRQHWCQRRRLSACFEEGAEEIAEVLVEAREAPDAVLMRNERFTRLREVWGSLTKRDRQRLADPTSPQTPAQRVALHRARKRLRTLFHQP